MQTWPAENGQGNRRQPGHACSPQVFDKDDSPILNGEFQFEMHAPGLSALKVFQYAPCATAPCKSKPINILDLGGTVRGSSYGICFAVQTLALTQVFPETP